MGWILQLIYADILEFHKRAIKYFTSRSTIHSLEPYMQTVILTMIVWRKVFEASWRTFRSRFDTILDNLRSRKVLIMNRASLLEFEMSRSARKSAEDIFEQQAQLEENRRLKTVLAWLTSADYSSHQDECSRIRMQHGDSGEWLRLDVKMESWFEPNFSCPNLWLRGIPGAGMTFDLTETIKEMISHKSKGRKYQRR